jgi:hypothetical protein
MNYDPPLRGGSFREFLPCGPGPVPDLRATTRQPHRTGCRIQSASPAAELTTAMRTMLVAPGVLNGTPATTMMR